MQVHAFCIGQPAVWIDAFGAILIKNGASIPELLGSLYPVLRGTARMPAPYADLGGASKDWR
jgi:hypothetical protein